MINASKDLYIKAVSTSGSTGPTGTTAEGILYKRAIPIGYTVPDVDYDEQYWINNNLFDYSGDPTNPAIIAKMEHSGLTTGAFYYADIQMQENNLFGNTWRYTDLKGNALDTSGEEPTNYVMDHLSGIMYYFTGDNTQDWYYELGTGSTTFSGAGYTDWRVPTYDELDMFTLSRSNDPRTEIPNIAFRQMTCTVNPASTAQYWYCQMWGTNAHVRATRNKTDTGTVYGTYARTFYYNDQLDYSIYNPTPFTNQYSYLLDGSNEYINLGNNSSLNFATADPFSLTAWVKPAAIGSNLAIHSKYEAATLKGYFTIIHSGGKLRIQIRVGSNIINVEGSTTLVAGTWYQVGFTYDGSGDASGVNIYLNGSGETTTTLNNNLSGSEIANTNDSYIGQRGGTNYFNGNIDNVAWWDSELTSSAMSEIYNSGSPGNLREHTNKSNLISWYRVDNDTWDGSNYEVVDENRRNTGVSVNIEEADKELDTA